MSHDPSRWKDGGDVPENLSALVTHARAVPVLRDDVRAALAAQLPRPPSAPTEPAQPAASAVRAPGRGPLASSASAWVIAGVAGAGIAAAIAWSAGTSPPSRGPSPTTPAIEVVPSASAPSPTGTPAEQATSPAPSAAPEATVQAKPKALPSAPSTKPVETATLSEESALVDRARANLGTNANDALAAIDEHARRFPRGELAPEREYLRISALRRLGRPDEARTRARKYLATYPSSSYVPSVRTILSELGGP